MKYNTTPFPPASSQSQGLRQPTGAQEGDADRTDQGEKGAHDPPGFLMPPHKKNLIGQISFISSGLQKASLRVWAGRQPEEGPLGTETQTACVYRGEGSDTLFDKGVM